MLLGNKLEPLSLSLSLSLSLKFEFEFEFELTPMDVRYFSRRDQFGGVSAYECPLFRGG
jgi:hypothetical protein